MLCAAIDMHGTKLKLTQAFVGTGMAFMPYAVYVLFAPRLTRSISIGMIVLALSTTPVVLLDRLLYGTWTVRALTGHILPQIIIWTYVEVMLENWQRCCILS